MILDLSDKYAKVILKAIDDRLLAVRAQTALREDCDTLDLALREEAMILQNTADHIKDKLLSE